MLRVAIIGGGASGTLAAMALIRRSARVRVTLIEQRSRQWNRGVAYSCRLSRQLLNVPAARMGAPADDPEDFLRWLMSGPMPAARPDDLVPRSLFGEYLSDRFNEVLDAHADRITQERGYAVGLDHAQGEHVITLADGRRIRADHVILALGNAPPGHPQEMSEAVRSHPGYIAWPWAHGVLDAIAQEDPVLFLGSGLTMVDVLLSLREQGHRGPITVLSRHGRMPAAHAVPAVWSLTGSLPGPQDDLLSRWRWLRAEVTRATREQVPWQSVMDAVKPHVRTWWTQLSFSERSRFLRHARPFWEVHRHRMPACSHEALSSMQARGELRTVAARLIRLEAVEEDRLLATYRPRGTDRPEQHEFRHVINCTGPQADLRRLDQPLLKDLLAKGLAAMDELHLGLRCSTDGAVIGWNGRATEGLYAIGPMCKAALWECTAIPEIRKQADELALHMARMAQRRRAARWQRLVDHLALSEA